MNKNDVKNILMSMRTPENEALVNNILGKIDIMDEKIFEDIIKKAGNSEDGVRKVFEEKLAQGQESRQNNGQEEKFPINDLFTYGISGNCIHLHLPVQLSEMKVEGGISKKIDTVKLYLLDAISKISQQKANGFYKFQGKDTLYMISPILRGKQMRFFEDLDFKTENFTKENLNDETYLEENPEARLAVGIFGKDTPVGRAEIGFDTIATEEWQEKKNKKIQEFAEKGIVLEDKSKNVEQK